MHFSFPWGHESLEVELPSGWPVEVLEAADSPPGGADRDLVEEALDRPIGARRLEEEVRPGQRVAIVVSDQTRLWQRADIVVPCLLERLRRAGVRERDVAIVVAVGMHRPAATEDMVKVVGREVFERVEVVSHDSRDEANLVSVGRDSRGNDVRLNRRVVEAERRLITGGIAFHNLAGFSGGAKAVMPGIAGFEVIQANHSLSLDDAYRLRASVGKGLLEGNPVAEGIREAGALLGGTYLVNTVAAPSGRLLRVVAGDLFEAHREGCRAARLALETPAAGGASLVVANAGGFRLDGELYQAIKGLDNATHVAAAGGTIVFSAACEDGVGSDAWEALMRRGDREAIARELSKSFHFAGYVALLTMEITDRCRVILVSRLEPETVRAFGMEPAGSLDEALEPFRKGGAPVERACVLPAAMITVPKIVRRP
ncbi:MAG: nickel-dependent lactate racemase [Deltaproteobacteria bacterium]|nr:nickel-dependent lactate racemase [Deltaproteobacteria bacterium]